MNQKIDMNKASTKIYSNYRTEVYNTNTNEGDHNQILTESSLQVKKEKPDKQEKMEKPPEKAEKTAKKLFNKGVLNPIPLLSTTDKKTYKSDKNLAQGASNKEQNIGTLNSKNLINPKEHYQSNKIFEEENSLLDNLGFDPKSFLEFFYIINEKTILEQKLKNKSLKASTISSRDKEEQISKNLKLTIENYNNLQNNKNRFSLDFSHINNPYEAQQIDQVVVDKLVSITLILILLEQQEI